MVHESSNSTFSRIGWGLSLWLSASLSCSEREAVIGDLAESGESGTTALTAVLGLVLRRQTAAWNDWRIWALCATVFLPVSFSLCQFSQDAAHESAVYTWMYANNWDWTLAKSFGFWYVLGDAATRLFLSFFTIASWSWSTGFALGFLPGKLRRASRTLVLLLLALWQLGDAPQRLMLYLMHRYGPPNLPPDPNAPVTAITVYTLVFPWILLALVVVLPLMLGIKHGEINLTLNMRSLVVLCVAILTTLTMLAQVRGLGLLLGASAGKWIWQHQSLVRSLALITFWPPIYIVGVRVSQYMKLRVGV